MKDKKHSVAIQVIGKCLNCGKEILSGYEYPSIGKSWFCSNECLFSLLGISYKIAGVEK